ncbi:DNA polymerase II large subunit [Candidatus Bathyarchaeota archaeon]|nr:DNA polymerase II large subunit [Candidatus Bathyarchaeota archaeon]
MFNFQNDYLNLLKQKFFYIYKIAEKARAKGFDPSLTPESLITIDIAERVEKAVGPEGIALRIRELSKVMSREDAAFKITEEIVSGKYGVTGIAAAEQAIRTALSILDEGVTIAPIQGIVKVEEGNNLDGTKYLSIYFAGPIRSAGGTEMALTLIVADYARRFLGLDRYKASQIEAKRFLEELRLYERAISKFQYKFPDEVIFNAIMNLPIDVNGVETDPVEVSSFRNLPRIKTNRVRGGALRVVNDGLLGRANKVLKIINKLGINGWEWLNGIQSLKNDQKTERRLMFMEEVIAGRPIFSFPSEFYGFRLRYGRARNTGLASIGIHPATMKVLKEFIAIGTQLRLEKPGKAGIVASVDTIEPPVIKLKDESVIKVSNLKLADEIMGKIAKILFLGDILIGFGEFLENNLPLSPPGFVEEWWSEYLRKAVKKEDLEALKEKNIDKEKLLNFIKDPFIFKPSFQEALIISKQFNIPLHPAYTFFWETLSINELKYLRECFLTAKKEMKNGFVTKILLNYDLQLKIILEDLCIPHKIVGNTILIENDDASALWICVNPEILIKDICNLSVKEVIERIAGVKICFKGGTFIGARMGRPEKAKRREMKPLVHCLFPIGVFGGAQRNLAEAVEKNKIISVEIVNRKCPLCKKSMPSIICKDCGSFTIIGKYCPNCDKELNSNQDSCPSCKRTAVSYKKTFVNISEIFNEACKQLNTQTLKLVKCVKGLSNEMKVPEPIEKGILRAKYDLSVFKDGTIRFDATNAVLSHFKPSEVSVSIEKLKSIGYLYDKDGKSLVNENQLCQLNIQDIIIPRKCGEYFIKVTKFIDELLEKVYNLPPFYNVNSLEDLVGHLIIGLSPHTSVGVLGRIVGFTNANVCFAHPIWHAAKRRDCDGDEDSLALVMDVLLNFSKAFLPEKIGGMMDAPILLNLIVDPKEVARQAFNIETVERLPLEFYENACNQIDSKIAVNLADVYLNRLGKEEMYNQIFFTHMVDNINAGTLESSYTKFKSMLEKLVEQLDLAEKIRAVEAKEVAKKVVSTHLLRDLAGNLKAFSNQRFRCKKCNTKYRRIPLRGKCLKCGGELSLTVFKGTIEKYLEITKDLVEKYDIGEYYQQRVNLISMELQSIFKSFEKQKALSEFI